MTPKLLKPFYLYLQFVSLSQALDTIKHFSTKYNKSSPFLQESISVLVRPPISSANRHSPVEGLHSSPLHPETENKSNDIAKHTSRSLCFILSSIDHLTSISNHSSQLD